MMGFPEEPEYRSFDGVCRKCGKKFVYYNSVEMRPSDQECRDCKDAESKVICQEASRCEVECKHQGEHELMSPGSYGHHNCREVVHFCEYMKKALHCIEIVMNKT